MSKYVFHIPCSKYVNGQLVSNGYEKCIDAMAKNLAEFGINGFYTLDAVGHYKGRQYAEKLLVVFRNDREAAYAFKQICREFHNELMQEVYAYECDNEMNFFKVDDK